MHQPPFRGAGSAYWPPQADETLLTENVLGGTKLPHWNIVYRGLPTTSWHVAPVPRSPEFMLGSTEIGLLQYPVHGRAPVAPPVPAVPLVPPLPALPVVPPLPLVP